MKIALIQINTTVGDFAGNSAKIRARAEEARRRGAELAVFTELCVCGYPPRDWAENPKFLDDNRRALELLAASLPPIPAIVGFVGRANSETGKQATNRAALLAGGKVVFEQVKMLLPTYDVFDEARMFAPAAEQRVFTFGGAKLALTICEDCWNDRTFWKRRLYARDPVEEMAGQGANLMVNISASPFSAGKRRLRVEMLQATARRHRMPALMVNQVGGNDSLVFDGSSVAVDASGKVCAQAGSFEEDMVLFDTVTGEGEIHQQPGEGVEEIYLALRLGVRDYVHKCGFQQVIVGLSGGIDSSVVAALAVSALGAENVLGVGMPGPYSSEGSLRDARALAENLGIRFLTLNINDVFNAYRAALAEPFRGRAEDITEENLQARIRGNLLMALSNKFGALVLSTGNKSELAVGYCTLYGDLAGGLAVISDVPKMMVYDLARFINRQREIIPAACLTKPPSAELRPGQTDQDSLPPYELLDKILQGYIEEAQTAEQIAERLKVDATLVREIIERVNRAEYKRYQAPPGLKVTAKSFGLGRRFPIAHKYTEPGG
ncbi:MAG TPA: NAD+ synthase [Candidatus Xenobia bacterium]|nr:NAD+ synthase [Candidatus Xenobia bacterium]